MEIEKFELHGGSQDGRVFEFMVERKIRALATPTRKEND